MKKLNQKELLESLSSHCDDAITHCGEGIRVCDKFIEKTKNGIIAKV